MAKFCFYLFLVCALIGKVSFAQTYNVEIFNHKSEIGTNTTNTVAEDNDGYIWLGSNGLGLTRFDGKNFIHYNNLLGSTGLNALDIDFDQEGNILVATAEKGIIESHKDELSGYTYDSILELKKYYSVVYHGNRKITFSSGAIELWDGEKLLNQYKLPLLTKNPKIYSKFKNNSIVILFTSQGNFVVNNLEIQTLESWLSTQKSLADQCVFALQEKDRIILLTKKGKIKLNAYSDQDILKFFFVDSLDSPPTLGKNEYFTFGDSGNKYSYLATNYGQIYYSNGREINKLKHNHTSNFEAVTNILVDQNESIWLSSYIHGLFKISQTAFTPITYDPLLAFPDIIFYQELGDSLAIISRANNLKTYIGKIGVPNSFKAYDFSTWSAESFNGKLILGTDLGLYSIEKNGVKLVESTPPFQIYNIFKHSEDSLWAFIGNKGPYILNKKLHKKLYKSSELIDYGIEIISSTYSSVYDIHFFGGTNGAFLIKKGEFIDLSTLLKTYDFDTLILNAEADKRGIIWFSSKSKIFGYRHNQEPIIISDIKILKGKKVFGFIFDELGNIIVGTENGIVYIELNTEGIPLNSSLYGNREGYKVYETNFHSLIRSKKGSIKFASVEGMYELNTDLLPTKLHPKTPQLEYVKIDNKLLHLGNKKGAINLNHDENLTLKYNLVNPINPVVYYSYRINSKEYGIWSEWSKDDFAIINSSLGGGNYKIDIRASFDKITSSPVKTIEVKIEESLFKNESFMGILIFLLLISNVVYLVRKKNLKTEDTLISKDLNLQANAAGMLMLFGGVAILSIFNTAPHFIENLPYFPIFTAICGISSLVLAIAVFFFEKFRKNPEKVAIIGFLIVLGYNLVGTQLTNLSPIYIIGIILTLSVTPIVLSKLSYVIALSLIVLGSTFFTVYTVEEPLLFDDTFFVVDMFTVLFLVGITTYVRKQSLEKLIFTSGVINNDDFLVAAFNPSYEITYLNETFTQLLNKNLDRYIKKNINELSLIKTAQQNSFDTIVKENYKDKSFFNVSLYFDNEEIRYFQFTCKSFSKNTRVIIGQDITDKMNLEKYFEVIVNNSQDLIYRLDVSGHFTFLNKQCENLLEFSEDEMVGTFYTSLVHPEWQEETVEFYSHQFKNKIKNTYSELPVITKSGKTIWLGQHMTAILNEGDESIISGYLGIARNITDRKKKDEIINTQNKDIKDSINYAKRIQVNLLPEKEKFKNFFKEYFVLYKPKDIVSGDFFWVEKINGKTILINADCTGHGVPGAFMTLLGINLLNQIILENKITGAGDILNQLDIRLNQSLRKNKTETIHDGIECSVCIIDEVNNQLEYSLSGSKFLLHQEGEIKEIKGQNAHIGEGTSLDEKFESTTIPFYENDVLYLYTDGIVDQFGGDKGKKLKRSKFINFVKSIKDNPLESQYKDTVTFLNNWMQKEEQTDDICVIAIKRKA